jgi:hypothetical protein
MDVIIQSKMLNREIMKAKPLLVQEEEEKKNLNDQVLSKSES